MDEKPRVLIVDDTPMQLRILAQMLSPMYDVKVAKDGEKGLELAREYGFDLILLDIIMEGMSGFEVLAELKKSDATSRVPVILITAMSAADAAKGMALGAADFITKPFIEEVVKAKARVQIGIGRASACSAPEG